MLQNLVNLKPTAPTHAEKPPAKTGQDQTEQGFGQLLSKAKSAAQRGGSEDDAVRPSVETVGSNTVPSGLDVEAVKLTAADPVKSTRDDGSAGLKLGNLLKRDDTASAVVNSVETETSAKAELFGLVEAGTVLKFATDAANNPTSAIVAPSPSPLRSDGGAPISNSEALKLKAVVAGNAEAAAAKAPVQQLGQLVSKVAQTIGESAPGRAIAAEAKSGSAIATNASPASLAVGQSDMVPQSTPAALGAGGTIAASVSPLVQKPSGNSESAIGESSVGSKDLSVKPVASELLAGRVERELPRAVNQQRGSVEGQIDAIKPERDSLMPSGAKVDLASVKGVNDQSLTNLSQPAQTLISAVKENTNWSRMLSAPTVQFTESVKPNGKVLQALNVTLNPVELGKLELNLRMQQGQVTIEIRAESDQAYRALLVDQDALANTLRGLGFKVDGVTITGPQSDGGPQFQSSGQSNSENSAGKFEGETSRDNDRLTDEFGHQSTAETQSDEEDNSAITVI